MDGLARLAAMLGFTNITAHAQEFTPPGGKGRVIVAVSGSMGAKAYEGPARKLASFGYDVILLDGNNMVGDHGVGLKAAIDKAPQSPNALPGKVGGVGFSLLLDGRLLLGGSLGILDVLANLVGGRGLGATDGI